MSSSPTFSPCCGHTNIDSDRCRPGCQLSILLQCRDRACGVALRIRTCDPEHWFCESGMWWWCLYPILSQSLYRDLFAVSCGPSASQTRPTSRSSFRIRLTFPGCALCRSNHVACVPTFRPCPQCSLSDFCTSLLSLPSLVPSLSFAFAVLAFALPG